VGELQLRDATVADVDLWADAWSVSSPRRALDPVVERYWWDRDGDNYVMRRFAVERGGAAIGVAYQAHPRWEVTPVRFATVGAEILPPSRDAATLDAAVAEMEWRAAADGALVLQARAEEDDPLVIDLLLARGYHEDRRSRRWECDLVANRDRLLAMTEESRTRMRAQGVRLLTLAADRDPATLEALHVLSEQGADDIPTTLPNTPETFADFMRWLEAPDMHRDRIWIARDERAVLGVSALAYPPVRGPVGTAWTATARAARGRGIARALKCETVAQAIALGVERVRTGNDAANAPILHLNETMGYRPTASGIKFLRDV
jgi:RimJ/RimL family protein N-acetyltransferase